MGGEHGTYGRRHLLQGEDARAAHPFVELSDPVAFIAGSKDLMDDGDHFAAGEAEQHRFDVIPSAGQGIHAKALPELAQQLVGIVAAFKIHEDDARPSGNLPATETAAQVPVAERIADSVPAGLVGLGEFRVVPRIRSQKEVLAVKSAHGVLRLAGHDLIDAADLVADFPADFKKVLMYMLFHRCSI